MQTWVRSSSFLKTLRVISTRSSDRVRNLVSWVQRWVSVVLQSSERRDSRRSTSALPVASMVSAIAFCFPAWQSVIIWRTGRSSSCKVVNLLMSGPCPLGCSRPRFPSHQDYRREGSKKRCCCTMLHFFQW